MRFVGASFVILILLGFCGSGVSQDELDAVQDVR